MVFQNWAECQVATSGSLLEKLADDFFPGDFRQSPWFPVRPVVPVDERRSDSFPELVIARIVWKQNLQAVPEIHLQTSLDL